MSEKWKETLSVAGIYLGLLLFAFGLALLEAFIVAHLISFIFNLTYTALLFKKVLAAMIVLNVLGSLFRKN